MLGIINNDKKEEEKREGFVNEFVKKSLSSLFRSFYLKTFDYWEIHW